MFKRLRSTRLGLALSFVIVGQLTVGTALQLTAVVSIPIATSAFACNKDQLLASAQDVLDVVSDQSLIAALQAVSPGAVAKLISIGPTARRLVESIRAGDTSTALGLVNTIFPIVNDIANHLHANQQALGLVALANIALHFIVNHVKASLSKQAALTPEMVQAIDYGSQPAWGCDYHKKDKRCR